MDNLSTGYRKNIPFIDDEHFLHIDVRNHEAVAHIIQTHQYDIIIHLAAVVSVVETIENPEVSNEVNISALVHLLELSRKHLPHLKNLSSRLQRQFMVIIRLYLKVSRVIFNLNLHMRFKNIVVNNM